MGAPRAALTVVGGANVDLTVRCATLPAPSESVVGDDVVRTPGGKGANQAVAASMLGVDVSFVGCVGQDADGEFLVENFRRHSVSIDHLRRVGAPTGIAMIAVDEKGENLIVVSPGANAHTTLDDVELPGDTWVLAQLELPVSVAHQIAARSTRTILNASPTARADAALVQRFAVVIVNEAESHSLDLGALDHVVITLGSRGAVHLARGRKIAEASPPELVVVDTVGAGDCFAAAYATALVRDADPDSALRYAVTAGALATRSPGAQGSLPTNEEVLTWLEHAS